MLREAESMLAEEELDQLPHAVRVSALALVIRHGLSKLIGIAGSVALAHILFPADFGVFAIAGLLIAGVMMINDLGLGSSLVQQQHEPMREEMRAIFTFQQAIVLVAVAVIFLASPVVAGLYHLPSNAVWLTRFMGLYLVATSFRSMPEMLLTRHVRFTRIAIVEVVTAIVYQAVTVGAALAGLRFWALGLGLTIYAVSNALLINLLAPWPIGLSWNWPIVKDHMRFGIPYQGTYVVEALEMAAAPVLLGVLAGSAAVGYAAFAISIVKVGLMIPVLILQVGFPAMSRIQNDKVRLARALEMATKLNCYLLLLAFIPLLLFGREIIATVFSNRWLPAVPLLTLLLWWGLLRSQLTIAAGALNALGKPGLNFWFHVWAAALSWCLVVLLVPHRGLKGFGEALLLSALPLPLCLLYLKKMVPLRLSSALSSPLILFVVIYVAGRLDPFGFQPRQTVAALALAISVTVALYLAGAVFLERQTIGQLLIGRKGRAVTVGAAEAL